VFFDYIMKSKQRKHGDYVYRVFNQSSFMRESDESMTSEKLRVAVKSTKAVYDKGPYSNEP
jgi:hypothetical protein